MGVAKDHTGVRFGRLTALHRTSDYIQPNGRKRVQWLCECDCGNKISVESSNLSSGHTTSCGCVVREFCSVVGKSNKIHGLKDTPVFNSWNGMLVSARKHNTEVQKEWENLIDFIKDVGEKPPNSYLIRLDKTIGYVRGNVKWGTRRDVVLHKRNTNKIYVDGKPLTLPEACAFHGISKDVVLYRKEIGVPKELWFSKKALSFSDISQCALATFYVYESDRFVGFGITRNIKQRNKTHIKSCRKAGIDIKLIKTYESDGAFIKELEKEIKSIFADKIINTGIDGFKTEAIPPKYKDGLINLCDIFMRQGL